MKKTLSAYRLRLGWLLAFLLLLGATQLSAKVDVKNVNATVKTEDDPADKDKKKVTVTVTYDIEGITAGKGAIVSFDAKLSNSKKNLTIRPLNSELKGDFGGVSGDGAKQIVWEASKTIERLDAEGKYNCVIDISVEGQGKDPSRATLRIDEYDPTQSWKYFTTGQISLSNLSPINKADICQQSDNWQNTPDGDAKFFQGTINWDPSYRGNRPNPVWSGPISGGHCSAFLAAKDIGTLEEKVWVNFAGSFHDVGTLPNGTTQAVDYVFQVRYNRFRTTDTVKEFIKMGNAGNPGDNDSYSETTPITKYSVSIDVGKEDIESSNEVEVEVLKKVYKVYEGGGVVMEMRATGEGHFVDNGRGIYVLTDGTEVVINDALTFTGDFLVDTTTISGPKKGAYVEAVGAITSKGLPIFSTGITGWIATSELTLDPTSNFFVDAKKIGLNLLGGVILVPLKFKFVGGVKATSVQFNGRFLVQAAAVACVSTPKEDPGSLDKYKDLFGSPVGIDFEGAEIVNGALEISKVSVTNVGIFKVPGFCIKEVTFTYNKAKDSAGLQGTISLPSDKFKNGLSAISGGGSMVKGEFNGVSFGAEFTVPLEPPPLAFKKFSFSVDKLVTGPVTWEGLATFGHVDPASVGLTYVGPFAKLANYFPNIFEFDAGFKIEYPTKWGIKGGLRLFGNDNLGWLGDGSATASLVFPDGHIEISDGTMKLFNFGGTKPIMDGTFSGSILMVPGEGSFTLKAKGEVYIPDLVQGIPIVSSFSAMLGLPKLLASSELQIYNSQAMVILPGETDGTFRSIVIDMTKFPSPTAFSYPAGEPVSIIPPATEGKGPAVESAADTAFYTIAATASMGSLVMQIAGSPQPTQSVLVSPDGTVYSGTTSDSTVIRRVAEHHDSVMLWIVTNPKPGTWKLGLIDRKPTDVVTAFSETKPRDPFRFDLVESNRQLMMTWNATGAPDSSTVDFFLDSDNRGFDGRYIGSVNETSGTFNYTMSDSLRECGYYVYALRIDRGMPSSSYNETMVSNEKSSLQPPTGISMSVDRNNLVTLNWTPSTDTNVTGYLVQVTDAGGRDSIYGYVPFYFNTFQFQTEGTQGMTLSLQAVAEDGNTGCWSEMVGVPVSSVEEERVVAGEQSSLAVEFSPNPVVDRADLSIRTIHPGVVTASLYTSDGRLIRTLVAGELHSGETRVSLSLSDIPNGSYVLFATSGDETFVRTIVVRR